MIFFNNEKLKPTYSSRMKGYKEDDLLFKNVTCIKNRGIGKP